jgi:phosphatidylserine/phosphatidylglycerophosphate/cardiolipin synthase-like enzyme
MHPFRLVAATACAALLAGGCAGSQTRAGAPTQGAGTLELFFNDPLAVTGPSNECVTEACQRLLALIERAEHTIDLAAYGTRGQDDLLKALERAQARGVRVRLVFDRDSEGNNYYTSTLEWEERLGAAATDEEYTRRHAARQVESPQRQPNCERPEGFEGPVQCFAVDLEDRWLIAAHASVEDFTDPDVGGGMDPIMHHKFAVIDGLWVWTGSSNFSNSGTGGYNFNVVTVTDSLAIAEKFTREFNLMYEEGKFHSEKPANDIDVVKLDNAEVVVLFSPQDSPMRYVETMIDRARERIDVTIFFLTHTGVTASLIAAHQRGVAVRIIVDATSAENGYTKHEIAREAGIPVKVEDWGGKMHAKAAAIDGTYLVSGSMNWTSAGERTNDENTFLIKSPDLAHEFHEYFDYLWGTIDERWAKLGARPLPESWDSGTSCTDGVDNDFSGLVDDEDPGCSEEGRPSAPLPPHGSLPRDRSPAELGYRIHRAEACEPDHQPWWECKRR